MFHLLPHYMVVEKLYEISFTHEHLLHTNTHPWILYIHNKRHPKPYTTCRKCLYIHKLYETSLENWLRNFVCIINWKMCFFFCIAWQFFFYNFLMSEIFFVFIYGSMVSLSYIMVNDILFYMAPWISHSKQAKIWW